MLGCGKDLEEVAAHLAGGLVDALEDEAGDGGDFFGDEDLLDGAGGFEFGGHALLVAAGAGETKNEDGKDRDLHQEVGDILGRARKRPGERLVQPLTKRLKRGVPGKMCGPQEPFNDAQSERQTDGTEEQARIQTASPGGEEEEQEHAHLVGQLGEGDSGTGDQRNIDATDAYKGRQGSHQGGCQRDPVDPAPALLQQSNKKKEEANGRGSLQAI